MIDTMISIEGRIGQYSDKVKQVQEGEGFKSETQPIEDFFKECLAEERAEIQGKIKESLYKGIDEYQGNYEGKFNEFIKKYEQHIPKEMWHRNPSDLSSAEPQFFRTFFSHFMMNKNNTFEDNCKVDTATKNTDPDSATIPLKNFLGDMGYELYQLALEEEMNSKSYRNTVFAESIEFLDTPKWQKRVIGVVGGPSGSGKSTAFKGIIREIDQSVQKTENKRGNYILRIDGGVGREVSQMRNLVSIIANNKGYPGITDLYEESKRLSRMKGLVEEAIMQSENLHFFDINTFSSFGLPEVIQKAMPNSDLNALKAKKERAEKTNSLFVFSCIEGQDPEKFQESVAVMGQKRAWKTDFVDYNLLILNNDLKLEEELNNDLESEEKLSNDLKLKKELSFSDVQKQLDQKNAFILYNHDYYHADFKNRKLIKIDENQLSEVAHRDLQVLNFRFEEMRENDTTKQPAVAEDLIEIQNIITPLHLNARNTIESKAYDGRGFKFGEYGSKKAGKWCKKHCDPKNFMSFHIKNDLMVAPTEEIRTQNDKLSDRSPILVSSRLYKAWKKDQKNSDKKDKLSLSEYSNLHRHEYGPIILDSLPMRQLAKAQQWFLKRREELNHISIKNKDEKITGLMIINNLFEKYFSGKKLTQIDYQAFYRDLDRIMDQMKQAGAFGFFSGTKNMLEKTLGILRYSYTKNKTIENQEKPDKLINEIENEINQKDLENLIKDLENFNPETTFEELLIDLENNIQESKEDTRGNLQKNHPSVNMDKAAGLSANDQDNPEKTLKIADSQLLDNQDEKDKTRTAEERIEEIKKERNFRNADFKSYQEKVQKLQEIEDELKIESSQLKNKNVEPKIQDNKIEVKEVKKISVLDQLKQLINAILYFLGKERHNIVPQEVPSEKEQTIILSSTAMMRKTMSSKALTSRSKTQEEEISHLYQKVHNDMKIMQEEVVNIQKQKNTKDAINSLQKIKESLKIEKEKFNEMKKNIDFSNNNTSTFFKNIEKVIDLVDNLAENTIRMKK